MKHKWWNASCASGKSEWSKFSWQFPRHAKCWCNSSLIFQCKFHISSTSLYNIFPASFQCPRLRFLFFTAQFSCSVHTLLDFLSLCSLLTFQYFIHTRIFSLYKFTYFLWHIILYNITIRSLYFPRIINTLFSWRPYFHVLYIPVNSFCIYFLIVCCNYANIIID